MKRILCFLLSAALIFSLSACSKKTKSVDIDGVRWSYEKLEDGTLKVYPEYKTDDNGARVYTSELVNIKIPSEIKGDAVTAVADMAFYKADSLKSVDIPPCVKFIGNECFFACSSLESVLLPEGVKTVGNKAFGMCSSLSQVALPASLTQLGENVFDGCTALSQINASAGECYVSEGGVLFSADKTQLIAYPPAAANSSYEIPSGVKSLEKYAFSYAVNLENIIIPSSVSAIATSFDMCTQLKSIDVARNNLFFMGKDGVLYDRDGKTLIKYPAGKTSNEFTVPYSVVKIAPFAFGSGLNLGGCRFLSAVTITENVDSIGEYAFANCNMLYRATFTGKPSDIGEAIFTGCKDIMINVRTEDRDYFSEKLTALDTTSIITAGSENIQGGYETLISYAMIKIGDFEYSCEIKRRDESYITYILRKDVRGSEETLFETAGEYRFDYIPSTYEAGNYKYLYFTARDMEETYSHSAIYVFDISGKTFSLFMDSPCSPGMVVFANPPSAIAGLGWVLSSDKIIAVNLKEARINDYRTYKLTGKKQTIGNFFETKDASVLYTESSVYALSESTLEIKTEFILKDNAGVRTEYYKYDCMTLKFSGPFGQSSIK